MDFSSYADTIQKLCRCCMHQTRKTRGCDANLLDVYNKITSRKLQDWNNMPKIICQGCTTQLTSIKSFIQKCVDTDEKFNSIAQEVFSKENEIKLESLKVEGEETEVNEIHVLDGEKLDINNPEIKDESDIPADDWIDPSPFLETQVITTPNKTEKPKTKQENATKKPIKKKKPTVTCFTCKLKFKIGARGEARKNLEEHYKNSEGCKPEEFKCTVCPRVCSTEAVLRLHMDVHSTEAKFKCEECGICFKQEFNLKRHCKNKHSTEPASVLCEFCPRKFNLLESLQEHLRKTHPDALNVACTLCPRKFVSKVGLKRHMQSLHPTGQPGFTLRSKKCTLCNICGVKVVNSVLKLHLNKHQGIKPFKCDRCPKKYFTKIELQVHVNGHLGIKPYKCTHCELAFNTNSNLHRHLRTHTGKKPHECLHCHKYFGTKENLKQHTITHTGERPHVCPYCFKGFTSRTILRKHINRHGSN